MNNYNQYEDNELMVMLKEPSPLSDQAFNVLYTRYSDKLYSYCLFKSDNEKDAEEIFQDSWLRFFNYVKSGNKIDSVTAFIYKIARNLSIDRHRGNKSMTLQSFDSFDLEMIADPLNLQSKLEKAELLSIISIAVNNLPDTYKETFLLLWFSGLNYSEIAEITGETIECIKKRSYRAMDQLLVLLEPIINDVEK